MRSELTLSLALLTGLTLIACGSSSSTEQFDYIYDFTVNGCATGKQEFSNQIDYCNGLKDEVRNHGCARETRRQTYLNKCGGDFDE